MESNLIELKNVSKFYKSGSTISEGMRKVSVKFNLNEFVAITGESGSGKTTLLNVISGLDSYEDGELFINGTETSHYSISEWEEFRAKYVGFVFQNYNIIDSYTVYENIAISLEAQNFDPKEKNEQVLSLIKKVGLESYTNKKASKLSGGEKQRVVIARALAKNAPIILADEPTGNLDKQTGIEIMNLLKDISKDKLVILVTHNIKEAEDYITRNVVMSDGNIKNDINVVEPNITSLDEDLHFNNNNNVNIIKKSGTLALRNLKATPRRSIFQSFLFMIIVAATLLTYLAAIKNNLDINNYDIADTSVFVYGRKQVPLTFDDIKVLQSKDNKNLKIIPNYLGNNATTEIATESIYNKRRITLKDSAILFDNDFRGKMPSNDNEIIIGKEAYTYHRTDYDIGDTIIISRKAYKVSGVLHDKLQGNLTVFFKSSLIYDNEFKYNEGFNEILDVENFSEYSGVQVRGTTRRVIDRFSKKITKDKETTNRYLIDSTHLYRIDQFSLQTKISRVLYTLLVIVVMVILALVVYLIQRNVMKNRSKDFAVYRSVGINKNEIRFVILIEQFIIALVTTLIAFILVNVLSTFVYKVFVITRRLNIMEYLLIALVLSMLSLWLGNKYNNEIFNKTVIESLKED